MILRAVATPEEFASGYGYLMRPADQDIGIPEMKMLIDNLRRDYGNLHTRSEDVSIQYLSANTSIYFYLGCAGFIRKQRLRKSIGTGVLGASVLLQRYSAN